MALSKKNNFLYLAVFITLLVTLFGCNRGAESNLSEVENAQTKVEKADVHSRNDDNNIVLRDEDTRKTAESESTEMKAKADEESLKDESSIDSEESIIDNSEDINEESTDINSEE
jgi:hypothetical protein